MPTKVQWRSAVSYHYRKAPQQYKNESVTGGYAFFSACCSSFLNLIAVIVQLIKSNTMFTLGRFALLRQLVIPCTFHIHYTHSVILAHVRTEHRMQCVQRRLALAIGQM